ncbi:PhzF family phenazine biosynthesis protein [Thalassobellus sediminis]|uniref:PhzF family phenazine biosynthesis protein n=1 Tax=Thalassobellus sediminis TaxID=3367753 RepID=UPI003793313C
MRLFTVDAFTDIPFKGNPAAVCVLEKALPVEDYIDIAQEMNLAETAFVYPENGRYNLRWFTPTIEVDLCGHATLATAKILFDKYDVKDSVLEFETKSGLLKVEKQGEELIMDFPLGNLKPFNQKDDIIEAFLNEKPLAIYEDNDWCIVQLNDESSVYNLKPNFNLLLKHTKKMFVITAKSKEYDFVSRFFGPAMGINEDPVTGSAHCYLANLWGEKLNQKSVIGYQASKRGGLVSCELIENNRVLLKGNCVIMSELLMEWM